MRNKQVAMIHLGCDKNRVDGEKMLTLLKDNDFKIGLDIEEANIVIVNTCAFLKISRQESINAILDAARYKEKKLEKLIVTGCLSQLNIKELQEALPEVDLFLPLEENVNIVKHLYELYDVKKQVKEKNDYKRLTSTPYHYAYLKVADGCNNYCTYCRIPYLRGKYVSTPIEDVVEEAKELVSNGVRELILVAQDLTNYGVDLYKEPSLVKLLKELSKIEGVDWIRLHYCYPDKFSDELINEIRDNPKIVKYLDIPLQHISDEVLIRMGRKITKQQTIDLIDKLRKEIPNLVIRTTIMVGFPGETNKNFKELCEFLKAEKLDLVGFFAYSREENTRSYSFKRQVFSLVKKCRLKKIQKIQQEIANKRWGSLVGTIQKILVDGYNDQNELFYGRTYAFSPEVDLDVYFKADDISLIGKFVEVKIVTANKDYLLGEIL